VLSVRSGYQFSRGWITGREAIVVTVRRKLRSLSRDNALPEAVEGIPVDVRQATTTRRLQAEDPATYSAQLRLSPDTGSVPHFDDEITPDRQLPGKVASAHAFLARAYSAKPQLRYLGRRPIWPLNVLAFAAFEFVRWPGA
jgi:hypothetical protein